MKVTIYNMEAKKVKNIRKRQIGIFLMITGVLIIGTQTGYAVQQNQLTQQTGTVPSLRTSKQA